MKRDFSLNLLDFGAKGDGVSDDTEALEHAIELVRKHGGGRVIVTEGIYSIRPINLTSHLTLYLLRGATIRGVANHTAWPVIPGAPSYGRGRDHPGPRYTSLLHGEYLFNVTLTGDGSDSVIDGNGPYWYGRRSEEVYTRGHLIEFMYSASIRVSNIHLKDSPFWFNHIYDCDDVHYQNVTIEAPTNAPNTDGWDPDSSRNVLIEDSTYHGGDDCVAIKSGWDCFGEAYGKSATNITVRNVTCQGDRAAGIAIGSEISGGIENILIEHVHFPALVNKPINIKSGTTRGGYIRNVTFRDLTVSGVVQQAAIHIDIFRYGDTSRNSECPTNWTPTLSVFQDISIQRVDGTRASIQGKEAFKIFGVLGSPIRNLYMDDVYFAPEYTWNCTHVDGHVRNQSVLPWPPCDGLTVDTRTSMKHIGGAWSIRRAPCVYGLSVFLLSVLLLHNRTRPKL